MTAYDVHNPPMMGCGHAANGTQTLVDKTQIPVCVICVGIVAGATEIVTTPSLEGRIARCGYLPKGHADVPSKAGLAFFSHKPGEEFDDYYCGCKGWD